MAKRPLGALPLALTLVLLAAVAGVAPGARLAGQDPPPPSPTPAPPPAAPPDEREHAEKGPAEKGPAPIAALDPERGLARAEAERKPIVVIAIAARDLPAYRTALAEELRDSARERIAEDFIAVEIPLGEEGAWPGSEPAGPAEDPPPWSAARAKTFLEARLGRLGTSPVLAVLDFSGALHARFDGEPPSDAKLKKALRTASAANQQRAKTFAEAEKLLEQLGLALKRKQHPEACRSFDRLRTLDLPLDSKLAGAKQERWKELETAYEAKLAAAKKLEDGGELAAAVVELEKLLQEFPLPEWQDENRRRVGILWRKIYGRSP